MSEFKIYRVEATKAGKVRKRLEQIHSFEAAEEAVDGRGVRIVDLDKVLIKHGLRSNGNSPVALYRVEGKRQKLLRVIQPETLREHVTVNDDQGMWTKDPGKQDDFPECELDAARERNPEPMASFEAPIEFPVYFESSAGVGRVNADASLQKPGKRGWIKSGKVVGPRDFVRKLRAGKVKGFAECADPQLMWDADASEARPPMPDDGGEYVWNRHAEIWEPVETVQLADAVAAVKFTADNL